MKNTLRSLFLLFGALLIVAGPAFAADVTNLNTSVVGMITETDSTVTSGTGSHMITWVLSASLGLGVVGLIFRLVRKAKV